LVVVQQECVGAVECRVSASNEQFLGEPCLDVLKHLAISYTCTAPGAPHPIKSSVRIGEENTKLIQLFGSPPSDVKEDRTCSFRACGGLTNQRISIVTGIVICMLLRRSIVLPQLNTLGTQDAGKQYAELPGGKVVPFSKFFDESYLKSSLKKVAQFSAATPHSSDEEVKIGNKFGTLSAILTPALVNDQKHVRCIWLVACYCI
jgi:hypothetical protein